MKKLTNLDALEGHSTGPLDQEKHVGIELEFISKLDKTMMTAFLSFNCPKLLKYVEIQDDGSIDTTKYYPYDIEVKVCAKEKAIPSIVKKLMKVIGKFVQVNTSCGLHVHLDMRKRNAELAYKKLVNSLPELNKLVKAHRLTNTYCQQNHNDKLYNSFTDYTGRIYKDITQDKYSAINPKALELYKTLEVRLHESTKDVKKIVNWCKKLIDIVEERTA